MPLDEIDLTGESDDEPIDLVHSDNEKAELVRNQQSSQPKLSSQRSSQHTNKSALRNLRHPSSSGSQRTTQANKDSAAASCSEPAQRQLPARGLPLEAGQQVRAGSEVPGTASKADQQQSVVSTAGRTFLSSGSTGAESTLPSANPGAQTSLPPTAANPPATLRPQQQPAAHQVASTQSATQHPTASSQAQASPTSDAQPLVSSPDWGRQHPSPLLRDLHAQRQAAAKTQATAGQSAQQAVSGAQQAAQAHSASAMEQMAQQVIASRQAVQGPASSQAAKGECLLHARFRHS